MDMSGMEMETMSDMSGMTTGSTATTLITSTSGTALSASSTATSTLSSTATAASTMSTAMATGMGTIGMSMSSVVGSAGRVCEIQMLWNWHTIGACFITPQWQIGSSGAMVGTCFGVIFLVMALEGLRRSTKQFDRYLIQKHRQTTEARYHQVSPTAPAEANNTQTLPAPVTTPAECCNGSRKSSTTAVLGSEWNGDVGGGDAAVVSIREKPGSAAQAAQGAAAAAVAAPPGGISVVTSGEPGFSAPYRPNVLQQMIRALLHAAQFTVAYFIMMLAMNYNGYIILSIIIGAYIGAFLFSWEPLLEGSRSNTSAAEEPTICCS